MKPNYELEPCPFCGFSALEILETSNDLHSEIYYVSCSVCHCDGPPAFTEESALSGWNNRESVFDD